MSAELLAVAAVRQLWVAQLQLWLLAVVGGLQLVARQRQSVSWAAAAAGVQYLAVYLQEAEYRQQFELQPVGTCLRLVAAACRALHVAAEKLEWG